MYDRETVMSWLEGLAQDDWRLYHSDSEVQEIARNALAMLKTMHRAWQTVKHSVLDTAQNNAGENGNEDVYSILMFVARLMDNQEKGVHIGKDGGRANNGQHGS